jgi:hypothetical protein
MFLKNKKGSQQLQASPWEKHRQQGFTIRQHGFLTPFIA